MKVNYTADADGVILSYRVHPFNFNLLWFEIDDPHKIQVGHDKVIAGKYVEDVEWRNHGISVSAKITEIAQCKNNLLATDYEAIKYGEGAISEEDYAPIKAQRAAWRARINELEAELKAGEESHGEAEVSGEADGEAS